MQELKNKAIDGFSLEKIRKDHITIWSDSKKNKNYDNLTFLLIFFSNQPNNTIRKKFLVNFQALQGRRANN